MTKCSGDQQPVKTLLSYSESREIIKRKGKTTTSVYKCK